MRTAITLGYPHDGGTVVLVSGTEVPIRKQRDALKEVIRGGKFHPEYSAIEIWESDGGCVKYLRRLPRSEKVPEASVGEPKRPAAPKAVKPRARSAR
jgi:hypothetical protein